MSFGDKTKKEDDSGLKMLFLGLGLIVSSFIMDLFAFGRRTRTPAISEEEAIQRVVGSSANVLPPDTNSALPGSDSSMQSGPSDFIKRQVDQKRAFDSQGGMYVPKNKADEGAYQAAMVLEDAKSAADVLKRYKDLRATQDDEWMTGFWEELSKQNPEIADYIEKSYMRSMGGTTNECHPSKFEGLNNGVIPDDMHNGFEQAGAPLSDAATVSIKRKDYSWVINDGDESYTIWKENDRISIYSPPVTFGTKGKPYMKGGLHNEQDYVDFAQDIRIWFDKLGSPPQEVAAFIVRCTEGLESRYIDIIARHQSPEVKRLIKAQTRSWWKDLF